MRLFASALFFWGFAGSICAAEDTVVGFGDTVTTIDEDRGI